MSPLTARPTGPRGRFRRGEIYLGWQYREPQCVPGQQPQLRLDLRAQPALGCVSPDWLAAQRREQRLLDLPAWLGLVAAAVEAAGAAVAWLTGALAGLPALLVLAVAGGSATWCLAALARGQRRLRADIRVEHDRVDEIRRAQQAGQARRNWHRSEVVGRQPLWYPVTVPVSIDRIDVAGGTQAGWSALLTMIGAPRMVAGGRVTVVDLTEGDAAADLVRLAQRRGIAPRLQVLPADLPGFDLAAGLTSEALADVLALTAAAVDLGGVADPAPDAALIEQVLRHLGPEATVAQLLAALGVLAQAGTAREQLNPAALSAAQVSNLLGMFGRGAETMVTDRAWTLESRLRPLARLGTEPAATSRLAARESGRLQVVRLDRAAPIIAHRTLSSFLVVALTQSLREAPASQPWAHTICLLGAERLPGDVLDRLCQAGEAARTGLVLAYRTIPAPVRERLGGGNAAVAFMRLGNAEDARAAAEQIGTEHRFVISQVTDSVGASVTDTVGDSCTTTLGIAESVADSGSVARTTGRGQGRATSGLLAATGGSLSREVSRSAGITDSWSMTEGISASTSWGWNTARAAGTSASRAGTLQRSREFVAEQHELQHLPHTAVLVCQPGAAGRAVVLADANPAIMALPGATLARRPAAPRG